MVSPGPSPACAVCLATYTNTGQQAGTAFVLSIAGRLVCKRCVEAGRDARRATERGAAQPRPTAEQIALVERMVEDNRRFLAGKPTDNPKWDVWRRETDALTALLTAVTGKDNA